ncbi:hypothetical protein [Pelagerythrobacter aerophilus]|nr:hypothetical protein [Pelagerythrobacter aerophilus]
MALRMQPANAIRIGAWSIAGLVLCAPLVAMQFTSEVDWTAFDFIVVAIVLGTIGLMAEFLFRRSASLAYRAGAGLALGAILFTIWANLAVGIAGNEADPFNLLYFALLAFVVLAAVLVRFRALSLALVSIGAVAGLALLGVIAASRGYAIWPQTIVLMLPWIAAAACFRQAQTA